MIGRKEKFQGLHNDYEKALADVIIRLNRIELLFEHILLEVIKPDRDNYGFIRTTLFNNSYLSFGSKFGLIQNILKDKGWETKDFDPIHSLIKIRNTFAHSNIIFTISSDLETGTKHLLQLNERRQEKIELKDYKKLYLDFNAKYDKIIGRLEAVAKVSRTIWEPKVVVQVKKSEK